MKAQEKALDEMKKLWLKALGKKLAKKMGWASEVSMEIEAKEPKSEGEGAALVVAEEPESDAASLVAGLSPEQVEALKKHLAENC